VLNVNFTDLGKTYALCVENGVLNYAEKPAAQPDAALVLSKASLDKIQLGEETLDPLVQAGDAKITGRSTAVDEFLALLDNFPFWFNIATP
jgi:alkyl sulfatase BDS1-like metallo-beta-lactamase superfamily hydrolase